MTPRRRPIVRLPRPDYDQQNHPYFETFVEYCKTTQGRDNSERQHVLRDWSHFSFRAIDMDAVQAYLTSPLHRQFAAFAYVTFIPTADHADTLPCDICGQRFTDTVHYPVKLPLCGHIFGAACTIDRLARQAVPYDTGRRTRVTEAYPMCSCPTPGCEDHIAPLVYYAFKEGLERGELDADRSPPPTGAHSPDLFRVLALPFLAWASLELYRDWRVLTGTRRRRLEIVPLGRAAMGTLRESLHHKGYHGVHAPDGAGLDAYSLTPWRRAVWADGWACTELAAIYEGWEARDRRQVLDAHFVTLLLDMLRGSMERRARMEGRRAELPLAELREDVLLDWYLEQLVTHSLVHMRFMQGLAF